MNTPSGTADRPPLLIVLVFLFACVYGLAQAAFGAWSESLTYDEPNHYAWSARLVNGEDISRDLAEWMRSQTPVTVLNVAADALGRELIKRYPSAVPPQHDTTWLFRRTATLALYLLLIVATWRLGTAVAGPTAGLLAGSATALDPSIIANGGLVTVDVAFGVATAAVLISVLRFGRAPSLWRAIMVGLAFGLAFSTKFTAVLLLFSVLTLPLSRANHRAPSLRDLVSLAAFACSAALWALLVIQAAFFFRHVGVPLGEMSFKGPLLSQVAARFPALPSPLPQELLLGIDRCMVSEHNQAWNSVLLNRFSTDGFWFYFPALFLMKTPVLALVATILGAAVAMGSGAMWTNPRLRWLTLTCGVCLLYFCVVFRAQVGYRYILFCLPLIYIIAAAGWTKLLATPHSQWWPMLVACTSAAELFAYSGNPLSFSNVLVQPKSSIYRYMADSNVDWAQNAAAVDRDLARLGIANVPRNPPHIVPGWNVLTTNWLAGAIWNRPQYRWVRENLAPDFVVQHTVLVYYISKSVFDRYLLAERTLRPSSVPVPCAADTIIKDGASLDIKAGAMESKCIETEGSTLRIAAMNGTVVAGPIDIDGTCRLQWIPAANEIWYRLERGSHLFCISASPSQTAHLSVTPFAPPAPAVDAVQRGTTAPP